MKRFEPKILALLCLPALAMLGLSWLLTYKNQRRDFGPAYRITRHEIIFEKDMNPFEKKIARLSKLPEGRAVVYRYEIQERRVSFLEEHLLGATNTQVWANGSSCREEKTNLGVAPHYSGSSFTGDSPRHWSEIYDLADIDDHPVVFSFPLSWEENGKTHSRTITKRFVAPNLK